MVSQRHEIHIPCTLIFQIINEICSAFDKEKPYFITTDALLHENNLWPSKIIMRLLFTIDFSDCNLVITVKRLHQGHHFDKLLKTLSHAIIPQCDTKGN